MASSTDNLPALLRQTASTSASKAAVPNDLEEPSSSAYNQLLAFTSQSLSSLREQPAVLETSKKSFELQLSTLCSRHVHSFVRVRTATASLPTSLDKLDQQLEALIERDLPALSEASQAFTDEIVPSIEAKERARNLLDQYDLSIKDLLDIPRLVMTCARASHPIEALQLGTHMAKIVQIERLSKEDDQSTLLLIALRDECWVHLKQLRSDLLRDLGARGVRLPAARRYLSLLRRLELVDAASSTKEEHDGSTILALSASTICLSFLQSRWVSVEEIGTHETDEDITTQTYSQISAWRDAVGESCTIALALFGDAKFPSAINSDELTPLALISSFASLCLDKLEDIIKRQLPRVVQSAKTLIDAFESLDTLHTQMAYAASSLSRQGIDFSQLKGCAAVFEKQALQAWSVGLNRIAREFESLFKKRNPGDASFLLGTTNVVDILQSSPSSAEPSSWSEEAARYPPLAQLANMMLDVYEAFIVFAPLTAADKAIDVFDEMIGSLVRQLFTFIHGLEGRDGETTSRLQLPPMRGKQYSSSKRNHEADLAICAKFSRAMCSTVLPSLRTLVLEAFESRRDVSSTTKQLLDDVIAWSLQAERAWIESERGRIERAEEEEAQRIAQEEKEQKRLADEQRVRDEEETRQKVEMQARLDAEEAARKAEKANALAKEAEQRRLLEEQRKEKEEHERRLEEDRQRQSREQEAEKAREAEANAKEAERLAAIERAILEEAERNRRAEKERLERETEEVRIAAEVRRQEEENEKRRQEEEVLQRQRQAEELERQKEIAEQEEQARLDRERKQSAVEAAQAEELVTSEKVSGKEADPVDSNGSDKADLNHTRISSDSANRSNGPKQSTASVDHQTNLAQAEVQAEDVKRVEQSATSEEVIPSVNQASENPPEAVSSAATAQLQSRDIEAPTATKVQAKSANRLAEKLRKRQEEREKAAAAAKRKAEEGA